MPKPARRVPKYRKHKPSGQAVVTLSGVDFYLGPHNSQTSIAEYDRLIAEWLAAGRRLPRNEEVGRTVDELILAYWEFCEGHYRKNGEPTSQQWLIKSALGPVRRLYGHTQADDFGPLALKACRQQMIDMGWVRESINDHLGRIRRMFKWGAENELVSATVYQALETVAGLRRGRSEAVEADAVKPVAEHLVDAVRPFVSRQVWAMVELQRLTAMRPGEVTIMRTADINMSGKVWVYVPESHKTEHHDIGREVYLGPQAQGILRPFLRADRMAYLFSPRDADEERRAELRDNRKTPVQPSQQNRRRKAPKRPPGERYTVNSYRHAIQRACERAFEMPADIRRIPKRPRKATKQQIAEWEADKKRRQALGVEWRDKNCWSPNQLRHNAATKARKESGLETAQILATASRRTVDLACVGRFEVLRVALPAGEFPCRKIADLSDRDALSQIQMPLHVVSDESCFHVQLELHVADDVNTLEPLALEFINADCFRQNSHRGIETVFGGHVRSFRDGENEAVLIGFLRGNHFTNSKVERLKSQP